MINVKRIFTTILVSVFCITFSSSIAFASDPSFSFYPDGGTVANKNDGFIVDVLIDSDGEELNTARFVITFDPDVLQLTSTERNNSLFDQWPDDESTIDNENGVVMLTGFTQSGNSDLYVTDGDPDVMARLTFEILEEGETTLNWEYTGDNDTFVSVMLTDGSPPQNILDTAPSSATFEITGTIYDTSNINTGVSIDRYIVATGVVLILFGAFMIYSKPSKRYPKHRGTIVVLDD